MKKPKIIYTVDYFINFFSKIPAAKWLTGAYHRPGGCCALGHCGYRYSCTGLTVPTQRGEALIALFPHPRVTASVSNVNDGITKEFPQKTPKGRILAALRKIKKLEESK